jgi:methylmalonyl-CoA mutase
MTDRLPLAADFPPATREDWLNLVNSALKGRRFETLIAKTYDGLSIQPLYPRAPDAAPIAARHGPWQVIQRIEHPDPSIANAEARHELNNGATGLSLVFRGAIGDYGFGLEASQAVIAQALDGIHLDAGVAIDLDLGWPDRNVGQIIAALVHGQNVSPAATDIRFGFDPLGAAALAGGAPLPWTEIAQNFSAAISTLANAGFRGPCAVADGRVIHGAGGSEAQELGTVLAVAVTYLRWLEAAGIPLKQAQRMILFRLVADADQFLTMAKFRALRRLWARVEKACGLTPQHAFIAGETAWRMMTRRAPWVNVLRSTIAAFSAGIGGADAISVLPFTAALGLPDRTARRLARNTQLVLMEEANLHRVDDPAAGAGGIEDLTNELCRAGWALFQEIERAGGAPSALQAGTIQAKVAAVRAARAAAIADRKDTLTGMTNFPHLAEMSVMVLDANPIAPEPAPSAIGLPPLPRFRLAEPFERLRDASDRLRDETGARPRVFFANLDTPAEFTARATFAKNFFEAGGIEAIGNDGFASRDEMLRAFQASGARLACICSSDEVYAREAASAAHHLSRAGATVYLAGRPGNSEASLRAAGVSSFIFAGCNALAELEAAQALATRGSQPSAASPPVL